MQGDSFQLTFNRGIVSPLAIARVDIDRVALAAEKMENWTPRVLGPMILRPGTAFIADFSTESIAIPFVFATDDLAILQVTNNALIPWVNEAKITRPTVSASITNGQFTSSVTGWTDNSDTGASMTWATGGYMKLSGSNNATAKGYQLVSVTESGTEHGLKIVIERGPVTLRVGGSVGGDNYIAETELGEGQHHLALTPTTDFYVQFSSRSITPVLVDSCEIESNTSLSISAPWATADLPNIRWAQSADVIYVACAGCPQYKIERRATRSWSVVKYLPTNGPFRIENVKPITLTPSATTGEITVTASDNVFTSKNVGGLYRFESAGQKIADDMSGLNQATDSIRVTGVGNDRTINYGISGTFTATVQLQRSVAEEGNWVDVPGQVWTAPFSTTTYLDGLDNQIVFYRMKLTAYTSGTATGELEFQGGSKTGVMRITSYSNEKSVGAVVLKDLGHTQPSETWWEGSWSDRRGYPSAVELYEGRLWWAGKDNVWGSETNLFESFDDTVEGDAGTISRSLGEGPVDNVNWMLGVQRLIIGTDGSERVAKSSSFDEPLSPTAFSLKIASNQGGARVNAVKVDTSGIFAQRSGRRVYEIAYDDSAVDYQSKDLTALNPEIGDPGIVRLAVQRQPDTRIWVVRSDGTCAVLVFDKAEQVAAWIEYTTDGTVEDVFVLPGSDEDDVYWIVNRNSKWNLEKLAKEDECQGGNTNKNLDAHVVYSSPGSATLTGLDHLEGKTVTVWQDGDVLSSTYVVSGGSITVSSAPTNAVVGLAYDADFESSKLARAVFDEMLTKRGIIRRVALILGPTHRSGLQVGQDFNNLESLPLVEQGKAVTADHTDYDEESFPISGVYDTDARLVLRAGGGKHCQVKAVVIDMVKDDRRTREGRDERSRRGRAAGKTNQRQRGG